MRQLHSFGTKGKSDAPSILVAFMSDDFDAFDVVPLGQHGGRRPGAGRPRKGEAREKRQRTNSNTLNSRGSRYVIARLMRDANDGCRDAAILLQGIYDGLISPYAAGAEMSYLRRREPNGRGSENVSKRIDWAMHRLFNPKKKGPTQASGAEFSNKEESPNVSAPAKT
jgi:hypothetical protein